MSFQKFQNGSKSSRGSRLVPKIVGEIMRLTGPFGTLELFLNTKSIAIGEVGAVGGYPPPLSICRSFFSLKILPKFQNPPESLRSCGSRLENLWNLWNFWANWFQKVPKSANTPLNTLGVTMTSNTPEYVFDLSRSYVRNGAYGTADPQFEDSDGRLHDVVMICTDPANSKCAWRRHAQTWKEALRALQDHRAMEHSGRPEITMHNISILGVQWLGVMRRTEDLLARLAKDPDTWIPARTVNIPERLVGELIEDGRIKKSRGYLGHPSAPKLRAYQSDPQRLREAMEGYGEEFTGSDIADALGISAQDQRTEVDAAVRAGVIEATLVHRRLSRYRFVV